MCRKSTSVFLIVQTSKKSPGVLKSECSRTLFDGKQSSRSEEKTKSVKKNPKHSDLRFKA